jgi:hypothetical protein
MNKSCELFTTVIFTMVFVLVTGYVLLWPVSSQLDAYASPVGQPNPYPCADPEYAAANPSKCGEDQGPRDEGPCADPEYAAANPSKCGDQGPRDEGPCAGDPEYAPADCRPPDCSIPEFASSDCGESAQPESSGPSTPPDCSIPEFASRDCGGPALSDDEPRMFGPPTNSDSGNEPQDLAGSESEDTGPVIDETEDQAIDEPQDLAGSESEEEFGTLSRIPSNITNNANNAMNVTGNDL